MMPELPEVETTLRGIAPHIDGKKIEKVIIRQSKLRWPIHPNLAQILAGRKILACNRRAKYLIITFETGILLIHLGMSGSLRIFTADDERIATPDKHDHLDFVFDDGTVLRYHDPRKFGAVLWYEGIAEHHPLLEKLGPEPLSDDFDANYLYQKLKNQKRAVKLALMDNAVVVGVGNIYANESLFLCGLHPLKLAANLTRNQCERLVDTIKSVLAKAIEQGGTTLKDFLQPDGRPGYFAQELLVYGNKGKPCPKCGTKIESLIIGQRNSFYCPMCQKKS